MADPSDPFDPVPITGTRPMHLLTEGAQTFVGGPEGAGFYLCRCGGPVFAGLRAAHERELAHATPAAGAGPTTEVRRG